MKTAAVASEPTHSNTSSSIPREQISSINENLKSNKKAKNNMNITSDGVPTIEQTSITNTLRLTIELIKPGKTEIVSLDITDYTTVLQIKQAVYEQIGLDLSSLKLVTAGIQLKDNAPVKLLGRQNFCVNLNLM